jgi:toxin YoeB
MKRILQLLKDIDRNGYEGIGKAEPLKGELTGFWSRRIDDTNRLVYSIVGKNIEILSCKGHYDD